MVYWVKVWAAGCPDYSINPNVNKIISDMVVHYPALLKNKDHTVIVPPPYKVIFKKLSICPYVALSIDVLSHKI